jgi:methylenetetrahydrofolate--tRNA-(uracil-5-)-methyltransferase
LRLKANPRWRFAGQITGCEGYVESAAIGLLAARFAAAEQRGETLAPPPETTAHGALLAHITGGHIETIDAGPSSFQPMNVNFGLFPPLPEPTAYDRGGRKFGRGSAKNLARKTALSQRALKDLARWIGGEIPAAAAE